MLFDTFYNYVMNASEVSNFFPVWKNKSKARVVTETFIIFSRNVLQNGKSSTQTSLFSASLLFLAA